MTDDEMPEGAFSLALPFDTDNADFRRGVEAGMLWEAVRRSPVVSMLIHADNAEMAIRIAEAARKPFTAEDCGADWIDVTIGVAS
jgi:hypothetical protein